MKPVINYAEQIGIDENIVEYNISLKKRTWIHRGGDVNVWFTPNNYEDLLKICKYLYLENFSFDIIGHTSNIYFLNSYNPSFVVDTKKIKKIEFTDSEIICDVGFPMMKLAQECIKRGIKGYEGFINLPGTVAGAVVNNSGCFGCEICDVVNKVEFLLPNGEITELTKEELLYKHRGSAIKSGQKQGVILRVYFDATQREEVCVLDSIAKENIKQRNLNQQSSAYNLGSTFALYTLKRDYRYLVVVVIIKILLFFNFDLKIIRKVKKNVYLFLCGKLYLKSYISDLNINTFLFIDDKADLYFFSYIDFIKKITSKAEIEIEIRR